MRKILAAAMVVILPVTICFVIGVINSPYAQPININFSAIFNWISGLLVAYCVARILGILVFNRFLPRLWMPKNMIIRVIYLFLAGIAIVKMSNFVELMFWLGVGLIEMCAFGVDKRSISKKNKRE